MRIALGGYAAPHAAAFRAARQSEPRDHQRPACGLGNPDRAIDKPKGQIVDRKVLVRVEHRPGQQMHRRADW